jgi:hypothetical protein
MNGGHNLVTKSIVVNRLGTFDSSLHGPPEDKAKRAGPIWVPVRDQTQLEKTGNLTRKRHDSVINLTLVLSYSRKQL